MKFRKLYSEHNKIQYRDALDFIEKNRNFLNDHFNGKLLRVVDLGTGCGKVLNDIVIGKSGLKFSQVTGIDISEDLIENAKKNYESEILKFQVIDIENYFRENDEKFDMIFSSYVLHWIKNYEKLFIQVYDALKPGGLFCFILFQSSDIKYIWEILVNNKYKEFASQLNDHFADYCFNYEGENMLRNKLEKIGFQIFQFENKKYEFDLKTKEQYEAKMLTINPFISKMPEDILGKFIKDQNSIMAVINGEEKPYNMVYRNFKVIAKKSLN